MIIKKKSRLRVPSFDTTQQTLFLYKRSFSRRTRVIIKKKKKKIYLGNVDIKEKLEPIVPNNCFVVDFI